MFQIDGNTEADRQTPMFGRGRIDHLAVQAASLEAFETIRERLMTRGAADDFVTDFGPMLSIFFAIPTGSSARSASRTPTRSPVSSIRPGHGPRATRRPLSPSLVTADARGRVLFVEVAQDFVEPRLVLFERFRHVEEGLGRDGEEFGRVGRAVGLKRWAVDAGA